MSVQNPDLICTQYYLDDTFTRTLMSLPGEVHAAASAQSSVTDLEMCLV